MKGKLGGTVFQGDRSGSVARNWSRPSNRRSLSQTAHRASHHDILSMWRGFPIATKEAWNSYAGTQVPLARATGTFQLTGQQQFYKIARRRWRDGIPASYWDTLPITSGYGRSAWSYAQAVTAAGGSVRPGELDAFNTFAERLWANDLFDSQPLMWIPAGDSLASALVTFYGAEDINAVLESHGFVESDWLGSGTALGLSSPGHVNYLSVPGSSPPANIPFSLLVAYSHLADYAGAQCLLSAMDGTNFVDSLVTDHFATYLSRCGDQDQVFFSPAPTSGRLLTTRISGAQLICYRDGVQVGSTGGLPVPNFPSVNFNLFAGSSSGSPYLPAQVRIQAVILSQLNTEAQLLQLDGFLSSLLSDLAALH